MISELIDMINATAGSLSRCCWSSDTVLRRISICKRIIEL